MEEKKKKKIKASAEAGEVWPGTYGLSSFNDIATPNISDMAEGW